MTVLVAGTVLTALVSAALCAVWGRTALLPGTVFGFLATGIQASVHAFFRPVVSAPLRDLMRRYGIGMGLRLAGIALIAVVATVAPSHFPPLPTGLAYLGVLIPLHFAEMRFFR